MKIKKILKFTLIAGMLILLLVLATLLFWLGPTVKTAVETMAPKALGTPVTIEHLSINPRKGTVELSGFVIENQTAYNRSNAVSLAQMNIAIDMGSLFSETVLVHSVQINSPHFTYEQGEASDNINEFIRNLQDFAGIDPNAPAPVKASANEPAELADEEAEAARPVIVERLEINDILFHLANTTDPLLDMELGIGQIALSMTNGTVQLKNLSVSNPQRLATPSLFELESISVKLAPESIYAETLVIEDVQVVKPHAYLEQNAETTTIGEFLKIAESFTAAAPAAPEPPIADTPEPVAEEVKAAAPPIELHNLLVDDIQLNLLDSTNTNAPAGPQSLASIGHISVKLVEGAIAINAITIPNLPAGFTTTNLFQLNGIQVALDPASVFSDQVVIHQVLIDSPLVNLEKTETTGNVAELQHLAAAFTPPAQTPPAASTEIIVIDPPAAPVPLAEQPVVLEKLIVTNLAVNMVFPVDTNAFAGALSFPSFGSLNPLAALGGTDTNAVETIEAADGQLTLISFDLLTAEPLKGLIQLANLQVGNPEGFANKNIVQLDAFRLGIDPDTLQSDIMLIREILIDNPTIAYERKILTDNIQALKTFIKDATAPPGAEDKKEPAEPREEEKEEGQKVVIEHLLVKSGLVKAKLSALPSAPIPLPKIEMRGIGQEKGGTSPTQAATEIGAEFYDAILGAVSSTTGFATDALKGVGALTLPILDTKDETVAEPAPAIAEAPLPAEPAPAPKKKKRRLPGRRF